jgi:hypothetical protein
MKKGISLLVFSLLFASALVSADVLTIEKNDAGSVVISGSKNPANFDFVITNNGFTDNFEIYTLIGITMTPRGTFKLESGVPTPVHVQAYPNADIRKKFRGVYIFDYELRSPSNGIMKDKLAIKIVDLSDVVKITPRSIKPSDDFATISIQNTENTQMDAVKIDLESPFFKTEKTISLKPYEQVNVTVPIEKQDTQRLIAGQYDIKTDVQFDDAKSSFTTSVSYLEQSGIAVTTTNQGLIISKKTIEKRNEGNIVANAEVESTKNILTRLFTVTSPKADVVEKHGLFVTYIWHKDLSPGETLKVEVTTNYTVPFILVILVIVIIVGVKLYAWTPVLVTKHATIVRTRGGETAIKVRLVVKAHSHADSVQVIDRIPAMMKMYDKAGTRPDKIDESTRRMVWNIPRLNAGEERVYTYIVYSSLRTVGRLELGPATVIYEKNGKTHEHFSNRAFVASESAR